MKTWWKPLITTNQKSGAKQNRLKTAETKNCISIALNASGLNSKGLMLSLILSGNPQYIIDVP